MERSIQNHDSREVHICGEGEGREGVAGLVSNHLPPTAHLSCQPRIISASDIVWGPPHSREAPTMARISVRPAHFPVPHSATDLLSSVPVKSGLWGQDISKLW
jgi:hypothetical protein